MDINAKASSNRYIDIEREYLLTVVLAVHYTRSDLFKQRMNLAHVCLWTVHTNSAEKSLDLM